MHTYTCYNCPSCVGLLLLYVAFYPFIPLVQSRIRSAKMGQTNDLEKKPILGNSVAPEQNSDRTKFRYPHSRDLWSFDISTKFEVTTLYTTA